MGGQAKDRAYELASDGKTRASDAIFSLGKIVDENATVIDEKIGPKYGEYARSAAQSMQDAAKKLDAKELGELGDEHLGPLGLRHEVSRVHVEAVVVVAAQAGRVELPNFFEQGPRASLPDCERRRRGIRSLPCAAPTACRSNCGRLRWAGWRPAVDVARTSGSRPRFPMRMTLLTIAKPPRSRGVPVPVW